MIRVLVVDDHDLVRRGLRAYLSGEAEVEVVAEAASLAEAERRLAAQRPDVALVDLVLPDGDGVALAAAAASASPATRLVALTGFAEDHRVRRALDAGFAGYLLKTATAAEVTAAVRRVAAGQRVVDPAVAGPLLSARADAGLTARELEVLRLVARGASNAEIASALFIGEKTVKTHVSSLLGKAGVADRTRLAVWAIGNGLAEPPRPA